MPEITNPTSGTRAHARTRGPVDPPSLVNGAQTKVTANGNISYKMLYTAAPFHLITVKVTARLWIAFGLGIVTDNEH